MLIIFIYFSRLDINPKDQSKFLFKQKNNNKIMMNGDFHYILKKYIKHKKK